MSLSSLLIHQMSFKLVDPYALAWLYLLTFKKKLTSLSCNRTINHLTMTPRFWEALSRLHFASFFLAVLRGEWLLSQLSQHHIPLLTTWSFSLLFLVVYFVPSVSNTIVPALQPLFATFYYYYLFGCPDQLVRTTTNHTAHCTSCKPSKHVKHHKGDRRT